MTNGTSHRFWLGFLLTVLITHSGYSQIPARLVLTPIYNGLENRPQFSCSDTVHGYLTLPSKQVGEHALEGIWVMPDGTEGEHTRVSVNFPAPGRQTAYVWLKFNDISSGSLGDLRMGGVSSDSNNPNNGQWSVKILWDGQALIESKFTVKCS